MPPSSNDEDAAATAAAQQQRCWPLVAAYCDVASVLRLVCSSAAIAVCLNDTPGFFRALLAARTGWQQQHDNSARAVLSAVVALATHAARAPCVAPSSHSTPPWLPGQPGRTRGFVAVTDPSTSLAPPLQLSATQLHLLAFGGPGGSSHTSGIFTSRCNSSPRSHHPCAHQAVVVSNKCILAEFYIPRLSTTVAASLEPSWRGILSTAAGDDSDYPSSCSSSAGQPYELWLHESVRLTTTTPPPNWRFVRSCVLECVGANAARCRAVFGTRLVAPGTDAAADVERCLLQLAGLGAPVLDLRRLNFYVQAATAAAAAAATRQQQHLTKLQSTGSSSRGSSSPAASALAAAQAALDSLLLKQQQHQGALTDLIDDDIRAELLAGVVAQLVQLAPHVEVLVLPVLLPGGRAARRLPSAAGGSKLSAPRLLSLNVPALIAMRRAWPGLSKLRQVLWLVGPSPPPPPPLPRVATAAAVLASVCEPLPQQQQQQQQPQDVLIKGALTLQQLETQLEQHAQVSRSAGAGNGWSDAAWFEQQLVEQDGSSSSSSSKSAMMAAAAAPPALAAPVGARGAACTQPQQQEQQLPRVAVAALLEMLHSCMDR